MADADGWKSPEQKAATIALARQLNRSIRATVDRDLSIMIERQAAYLTDYFDRNPPPKPTWRQLFACRVVAARERAARWLAPWLGDRSDF